MNAALLHGPRDVRIGAIAAPSPGAGDVLVRVGMVGVCGTDYRIYAGDRPVRYPRILGHELVGRVEAVGPEVARVRPGQRVAVEPNYSCGHCPLCREGNRNLCESRVAIGIDVDGGLAETLVLPERCCWPIASDMPDEQLVLVEPLAVVVRAVHRGAPQRGETAAVVGIGSLGLLALEVLRAQGLRVLMVSRTPRRFELARRHGADETCASTGSDLAATARAFSGREGVDLVVETAGTPEAVSDAVALVRPGGRVVLTGLPHEPTSLSFFSVVRREVTLTGSMIYQDEFGEALDLLQRRVVDTSGLVTHRFRLADVEGAFAAHRDPSSIKVTITV